MMMPNPIRLTRIVRKMTRRGLLISFRRASPRRIPRYALLAGPLAPLCLRGSLVSRATSDRHALDDNRRHRDVVHPVPRRSGLDRGDLLYRVPAVDHPAEHGVTEVVGGEAAMIEARVVD